MPIRLLIISNLFFIMLYLFNVDTPFYLNDLRHYIARNVNIDTLAQESNASDQNELQINQTKQAELSDQQKGKQNQLKASLNRYLNKECVAPTYNLLDFLGVNQPNSGVVMYYDNNMVGEIFTGFMAKSNQSGTSLTSFSTSKDHECTSTYSTTKVWNQKCDDVLKSAFSKFKFKSMLNQNTKIYELDSRINIFTVDYSGDICLTIFKESIFSGSN